MENSPMFIQSFMDSKGSVFYTPFCIIVFLFSFLLICWILMAILIYIIEIAFWVFQGTRDPPCLACILIPDSSLRSAMRILAVQTCKSLADVVERVAGEIDGGLGVRRRAAEKEELQALGPWPQVSYKADEMGLNSSSMECVICLDEFEDGDSCIKLPVCNHIFHLLCIDLWLKTHPSCPICRNSLADFITPTK